MQKPWGVTVSADKSRLLVSHPDLSRIHAYNINTGRLTYSVGRDRLTSPCGILVDEEDSSLYVCDSFDRVQVFKEPEMDYLRCVLMNNDDESSPPSFSPQDVAVSSTSLYVSDTKNNRVCMFDKTGSGQGALLRILGAQQGNGASGQRKGEFHSPLGLSFNEETEELYVGDSFNCRISVFTADGKPIRNILLPSRPKQKQTLWSGGLRSVSSIYVRCVGSQLIVTSTDGGFPPGVQILNQDKGDLVSSFPSPDSLPTDDLARLDSARSVACCPVLVADEEEEAVFVVEPSLYRVVCFT